MDLGVLCLFYGKKYLTQSALSCLNLERLGFFFLLLACDLEGLGRKYVR